MKNKSLTPKIRFKGYDDEWQQAKVRDVFTLGNGYTPSKANPAFWTNGTIPWFRMEDIRENGRVLADSIQHVTPEAVKSSGLFPAGSIIVSTTATIGEHALLIADSLANQRFTVFQTVNRWSWLKAKYLLYRFYGLGDWCRKNVNAGGLAAVSITDLQKYDIDFPSTAEERDSIADYFDNIDKLLVDTEREITRLEKMKQASLQKMFPRPGETTPEIRFNGFTEQWKLIQLRHICESFKYGLNAPAKKFDGIHKYLRITDIDDTTHQFNQADLTSPDAGPLTEEYRLHLNDIVFARTGASVGKTYLYDEKDGDVYWAGFLICAHVSNEFDSSFIFYITTTRMYWDYIAISSQRSGQPGVNAEQYAEFSFYVPTLPEQKRIGEYFRNLDAIISAKRKKLEKLQNLKQSCLDKMFVNTTVQ
ncbi:restriction endonuclease subunit S [Muribaculum sp.]|uniref:restriction endonuclease subunit S n=1 Tax=Muribaculum sp. TaxID=1918611 RepID=UPI0023C33477|nr:restriction endonuclease subunit S [Muribaculum sp.]MDE5706175.1 restriction endonuclease subunit S [Muribaculum sp.]